MPFHHHHHYGGGFRRSRVPMGTYINGQFHSFTLPYTIKTYRSKYTLAIFFFISLAIFIFNVGVIFGIGSLAITFIYLAPGIICIVNFALFYLLPFISIFLESMATCAHCGIQFGFLGAMGMLLSHIMTVVIGTNISYLPYKGLSIFFGVTSFLLNISYLIIYNRNTNIAYTADATKKLIIDLQNSPPMTQPIIGQVMVDPYGNPIQMAGYGLQPQMQMQSIKYNDR